MVVCLLTSYFLYSRNYMSTVHVFGGPGHDAFESSDLGVMFLVTTGPLEKRDILFECAGFMCFCYIASTSNWFMQIEPNRCNLNQCDILQSFVKSC